MQDPIRTDTCFVWLPWLKLQLLWKNKWGHELSGSGVLCMDPGVRTICKLISTMNRITIDLFIFYIPSHTLDISGALYFHVSQFCFLCTCGSLSFLVLDGSFGLRVQCVSSFNYTSNCALSFFVCCRCQGVQPKISPIPRCGID